ncbi:MAG: UDP-N-acetylmuramate dehydrogenase [Gammaproteobacteria bacterium]|nr:UDP-N-acetylmuramate dehydrogenase [Gammaproteobacteria bacterium]
MTRSLDKLNTLRVAARADRITTARTEADLRRIVLAAQADEQPLLVLGGGSNVVLRQRVRGIVCLIRMRGVSVEQISQEQFAVTAAAGESWHALVRYCLGRGLFGLENLALIPGSVGAAPLQNIGAYGVELADRLLTLTAMDTTSGEIRRFDRAACQFGYRDSVFKSSEPGRYVIVEVTLQLSTRPEPIVDYPDVRIELQRLGYESRTPIQIAEAVTRVRRRKLPDPRRVGNVGSFFKNPMASGEQTERLRGEITDLVAHEVSEASVQADTAAHQFKLSAAQLIDRAGWKGARRGKVGVWPRQPLVLVNFGGGSGAEFLSLAGEIRATVLDCFGVTLDFEPRVCGGD